MNGMALRLALGLASLLALPGVALGGVAGPPTCSVEIDKQVDTGSAGQDIARKLGELGFPKRPASP